MKWASCDPGEIHSGVTRWDGVRAIASTYAHPRDHLVFIEQLLRDGLDLMVYERFALDLRRASEQNGSEFPTCEMIGVIKWLCRKYDTPVVGYFNHVHKRIYKMDWYLSLTNRQKRKLPWWGVGPGEHAKDSWCLGMWHRHSKMDTFGLLPGEID